MLKAGALFVAVTISFVIAVLISLLITLAFHYKIQNRENLLQKKLERNANSTIALLMSDNDAKDTEKVIDLYGEGTDSVRVKKYSWGAYQIATVKSFSGRYQLTKTVEYGYKPNEALAAAIYLTDMNMPLSLSGKTKITGTCFLPEADVQRGYVDGRNFEGTTLINGVKKRSKNVLPPLEKEFKKKLYDALTNTFQGVYKEMVLEDSLVNTFQDTTILIRLMGGGDLTGKYLSGNIIVYSDRTITIDATSRLEDILIYARAVKINKKFNGSIQAFATDSILVEENCRLAYPSTLGLFKKDHSVQGPFIKLMKNVELAGMIFTSKSDSISDRKETLVTLEEGSKVHGHIYVDGFANIGGTVKGMVWCNNFTLDKGTYTNYLLNAVIDLTQLSVHYAGSGIVASGTKRKIIKWLE